MLQFFLCVNFLLLMGKSAIYDCVVLCCGISCYGCMFAFVVLDLVFSILSQRIFGGGGEERLRSDIFCVGWDVKL